MLLPYTSTLPAERDHGVLNSYVPTNATLFSESMLYGLRTMWWQEWLDEKRFDSYAQSFKIPEADWKNSEHYRDGIDWFEGMTLNQAGVLAESFDRNQYYGMLTQNVDIFSGTGATMMAGILLGSIPDPLNFAPFLAVSQRVVRSGRMIKKVNNASKVFTTTTSPNSIASKVIADVVDPMLGAGLANLAIADKRSKFQEEHDAKMVLMDLAIAGGIGLGIAGAKGLRRLSQVDPEVHANRIAMGMEQLEAGEGLNLAPHPHKGWNYHNATNTTIEGPNGTIYSNAVVRVLDDNYLDVDTLSVLDPENAQTLIEDGLETANAMGYKGLFIKDGLINDLLPMEQGVNEVVLADLDGTKVQIERVPEAKGTIISDVLTEADGVSWEHIDTNNQWAYNETANVVAESIQDRIRKSIGEFAEVSDVVKRSVDEIGGTTKNITDTVKKVGERVTDAANCLIKNG
jgi:hypothetical protein